MIELIITGAIGGLAYSLSGLANKDKRENFDWMKMVPTIVVSAIVGGIAGATGQDYGMVINGSAATGITVVVEKLYKALIKKIKKK